MLVGFSSNAFNFLPPELSMISIPSAFLNSSAMPFQSHQGSGLGSYLVLNLNFTLIKPIVDTLIKIFEGSLRGRGEAHITIISPLEFKSGLKSVLTIEEINSIALAYSIQSSTFSVLCLARQSQFDAKLGKRSFVYNFIVQSSDLLEIRKQIEARYIEKGGDASNFDPDRFYPHITLAFEEHGDWFPEDQVFKTKKTCISLINNHIA
jgi:hypothetical protein